MQVKKANISATELKLTVVPSKAELGAVEKEVLLHMNEHVKVPGFRPGKAPASVIAKHADPNKLQEEFLDHAISQMYVQAIESENIRPVGQPKISIKKFVPFSDLEFEAEIEAIGDIILPDYKKIRIKKQTVVVTDDDIKEVLESLRERAAEKKEVTRAAKDGDEVLIDFKGTDPKTKKPVSGADGKDYPLVLGSQSFIPGFEAELIGLKAGAEKTFDITFPKDYNVSALQSKKVTFAVKIKKIQELAKPKLDSEFVSKVSPFKTLAELKADIRKQLTAEKQAKEDRGYESELISKIATEATVAVPASLVDQQIQRSEDEERQNLTYRGQTWQEHLEEEGITEQEHRDRNRPMAEQNVKASLVLSEIADKEKIAVTPEEADIRLQILKGQYTDAQMLAELDKPENRQTIVNQILTEKTFAKLVEYANKK